MTTLSKTPSKVLIRPAHLYEAPMLGKLAAATYDVYPTALSTWLHPHRSSHWSSYERNFIYTQYRRMLNPRSLTFAAVPASSPNVIIGYIAFIRFGTDFGAQRQLASRDTYFLRILAWIFWFYAFVVLKILPDQSIDLERVKIFERENASTEGEYWDVEGRRERWHVVSIIVDENWQGRGVGKMLMAEVIARAEEEDVVIGLEASEAGEKLYKRLGFELLSRFKPVFAFLMNAEHEVGGHMMYRSEKLKEKK